MVFLLIPAMSCLGCFSSPVCPLRIGGVEMSSNAGGLILWPVLLLPPVGFGLVHFRGSPS